MNVTTIGFPIAAPASTGTVTETGSGFAGALDAAAAMLGGVATGTGLAGATANGTGVPAPTVSIDTATLLVPIAADAGQPKLPVAMDQLLATAGAPAIAPAPVATGANPLADAVARALGNAKASDTKSVATATPIAAAPAETTNPLAAAPAETTNPLAATADAAQSIEASAEIKTTAAALKDAAAAALGKGDPSTAGVALNVMEATAPAETPAPTRLATPGKPSAGKAVRGEAPLASDAQPADSDSALAASANSDAQTLAAQQALAQAQQPRSATTAPATHGGTATAKGSAARIADGDSAQSLAADVRPSAAPASGTELAKAIAPHGGGDAGLDAGSKGDGGTQQNLAHQLSVSAPSATGVPAAAVQGAPSFAAAVTSATSQSSASEPVIHARAGELGRSLGVEIARKVNAGEDTLRVRLNPAELGRVEVTLAFDDKGTVQATMRAESQQTLDMLRQDAPDLGRALDQAGIRTDSQSFRFENRDGSNAGAGNGQSAFQQQSRGGNQQFHDEADTEAPVYRPVRSDGQVDLIA